jgi:hypothetical protein
VAPLFIQDDKKILFILEFRSITQPSFVFNLLEQEIERIAKTAQYHNYVSFL